MILEKYDVMTEGVQATGEKALVGNGIRIDRLTLSNHKERIDL